MGRDVSDESTAVQGYPYRGGPMLDIEHTDSLPPTPPGPPRRGRGIWPWLVALLALVIVGLAGVYAFADRGGPSKEQVPRAAAAKPTTAQATTRRRAAPAHKPKRKPKPAVARKKPKAHVKPLVVVPGVVGLSQDDAETTLSRAGLQPSVRRVPSDQAAGQVVAQHPGSGADARRGAAVLLNVSAGKGQTQQKTKAVPAPDLVGRTLPAARRILRSAGLRIEIRYVPSSQPAGTVLGQSPRPGVTVPRGAVFVTVSKGKPQPTGVLVPDVTGEDQSTATSDLRAAGFTVSTTTETTTDPAQDGTVIDEQPSAGTRAPKGSTVTITIGQYQSG